MNNTTCKKCKSQKFRNKLQMVFESKKVLITSAIFSVILVISLSCLAVHYNGKCSALNKKISEQNKTIIEQFDELIEKSKKLDGLKNTLLGKLNVFYVNNGCKNMYLHTFFR